MKKNRLTTLFFLSNLLYVFSQSCQVPSTPIIQADNNYCKGSTAVLEANSNVDTFRWYDSPTEGNLLSDSKTLIINNLSKNQSVWVEAYQKDEIGITKNGARLVPNNFGGASVSSASQPWGLRFTIFKDILLKSVDVYLRNTAESSITIQLQDSNYKVLESKTLSLPIGNPENPIKHTLELNFEIPKGVNYSLVTPNAPNMVRETQNHHSGFPFMLGDIGMVTQGMLQNYPAAANSTTYYYFYNWEFTSFDECISTRVKKDIIVNEIPNKPSGNEIQNYSDGQTLADLQIEGMNLKWYSDPNKTEELPSSTKIINNFNYYVSQTIAGCESDLLKIFTEKTLNISELNEYKSSKIITPNPIKDVFNISINKDLIQSIEIYDINGKKIEDIKTKSKSYNISHLNKGLYILTITLINGESITNKFLKI